MSELSIIVADTGPLVALAGGGVVPVLHALFEHVIVPKTVADELNAGGDRPGARLLAEHAWLEVRAAARPPDPLLAEELDAGEAEAIALAIELGRVPVLLDERRGRRIATRVYGLEVRGTLGVLTEARRRGQIPVLATVLERLVSHGIYLSPKLIDDALRAVGEK